MRPKKHVLLAGDDADHVGTLGYLLRIHGFEVFTATGVIEAEQAVRAVVPFDLVVVVWPLAGAEDLLTRAKEISSFTPTLVVSRDNLVGILPSGHARLFNASSADIVAHVRMLTARKRGPRPGSHVAAEG